MYLSMKMKLVYVWWVSKQYKQYIIDNWMYTLHVYSIFKNKQITKKKHVALSSYREGIQNMPIIHCVVWFFYCESTKCEFELLPFGCNAVKLASDFTYFINWFTNKLWTIGRVVYIKSRSLRSSDTQSTNHLVKI
jgi:hypothetical protein